MGKAVPSTSGRLTQAAERRSLRLDLERGAEAPAVARAAVTGLCFEAELDPDQHAELILVVSELVTNAVVHSDATQEAPIVLGASLTDESVRIDVTDAGSGFTPTRRRARADDGYGLYVLDHAASRWGVDRDGGNRVWLELSRAVSRRRARHMSALD
jgi:anti-sigma regulatory factor (Ser/Thr protein kinase)